jgi:hypothetical protein
MAATTQQQSSAKRRVKVYRLNAEGTWDDSGTGYVDLKWAGVRVALSFCFFICAADFNFSWHRIIFLFRFLPFSSIWNTISLANYLLFYAIYSMKDAPSGGMHLVVTAEEDESATLLHSRVSEEDIYQRQQGSCSITHALTRFDPGWV